jgi:hypothetical protein
MRNEKKNKIIIRMGCKEGNYSMRRLAGIVLLMIMTNHLCSVTYMNTEAKEQFQHNLSHKS